MRVNILTVAGALLSINLFALSVIGVIDLRRREGTNSAPRRLIRVLPSEHGPSPPEPETLPRPAKPPNSGSGGQSPANGGSGSNSPQAEQVYAPEPLPNRCLEEGGDCIDKASELVKEIAKKLADAGGSTTTTSGTFVTVITPAPVPNYDIITAVNMYEYLPLLNTAEQRMWSTDPLCFFANLEGYYTAAASSSAAARITPSTTSSASLLRRADPLDGIIQCMQTPYTGAACATPTSTLPGPSFSSLQSAFFSSYMPSALLNAYGAPRNGSLSTATTTCSGLHSSGSVTATYVVKAAAAATTSTSTTSTGTGAGGTPSPTTGGGERSRIPDADTAFLGGLVALLMI